MQVWISMFCDHTSNTGQGHLRSPGKKGQTPQKIGIWHCNACFRSNFRKEHKKPKKLLEKSKSVKKGKSRENGKIWLFSKCYMLYLSQFKRYRLEILYTYSSVIINYIPALKKVFSWTFSNRQIWYFWDFFLEIFEVWKIRDSSCLALLIVRHII